MYYYERRYGTGRAVVTVVECIVWLVALAGVMIAIGGFELGRQLGGSFVVGFVASILGLVISALGFIGVMMAQQAKAQFDATEMTRDMLGIQRLHYKQVANATNNHELSSFITSFAEGRSGSVFGDDGRPEPENDGMLQVPKQVPQKTQKGDTDTYKFGPRQEPRL